MLIGKQRPMAATTTMSAAAAVAVAVAVASLPPLPPDWMLE